MARAGGNLRSHGGIGEMKGPLPPTAWAINGTPLGSPSALLLHTPSWALCLPGPHQLLLHAPHQRLSTHTRGHTQGQMHTGTYKQGHANRNTCMDIHTGTHRLPDTLWKLLGLTSCPCSLFFNVTAELPPSIVSPSGSTGTSRLQL